MEINVNQLYKCNKCNKCNTTYRRHCKKCSGIVKIEIIYEKFYRGRPLFNSFFVCFFKINPTYPELMLSELTTEDWLLL